MIVTGSRDETNAPVNQEQQRELYTKYGATNTTDSEGNTPNLNYVKTDY